MRWFTFLAFAVFFGAIFYAIAPQDVNRFFGDLFHRTRNVAVNAGSDLSTTIGFTAATVSVGGRSIPVQVADNDAERYRGLSGRASLEADRGMLFVFPTAGEYGFTMRGMRFPLDFIWIRSGRVSGVTENVPPPAVNAAPERVDPPGPVDAVLEVNAGSVRRWQIAVGQAFLRSD